jgi:hypothetical protein
MPTFAQLQSDLQSFGWVYVAGQHGSPGKAGILLKQTPKGAILQNLNMNGEPIRFGTQQIQWLVLQFPELTDVLSRNMETMRRVQGLKSRLQTFMAGTFQPTGKETPETADAATGKQRSMTAAEKAFVENLPQRKYMYLESLDTDPNRALPKSLSDLKISEPEKLPRSFTVVDATDPKNPVRLIFQIEFDTGGFRTDEAFIRYKVSSNEMNILQQQGKTFLNDVRKVPATDVRVFYSDVNKQIFGETLLDHHRKTLETLKSTAQRFFDQFELKATGPVDFATKEVYLKAHQVSVTDGQASVGRATAAESIEAIDKVTTTSVRVEPFIKNGVTNFTSHYEARGMQALRGLTDAQIDDFLKQLAKIGDDLLDIVKKAAV